MIPDIVYQFIKQAKKLSKKDKQRILDVARTYYNNEDPDDPKHRWDHMLDVMEVAKKIRGRDLDRDEFGMIAFHDSGYKHPLGYSFSKKIHGQRGAEIFKKEGPKLGFTPEEVKRISRAIRFHMRKPDKRSPLMKNDLQMLMFGADEGTPKPLKEDAKKYLFKARAGIYSGISKDDPDFIKKLVAKVRTFGDYSTNPRLEYYRRVYPTYHKDLYNYWQSDQLEKDYEDMIKEEKDLKKKEKKAEFDLPDLKTNPRNKITRLIKNLKWGVRIDGKPDSPDERLFNPDPKKKYEVIGDDSSDLASCVDLTNRVVKNTKGVGSLATLTNFGEIPHLTPMFKHKGKYYIIHGEHQYSKPYDKLEDVGERWYTDPTALPVPEYIDFYDLPAGETIDEKDLRKIINEVKKKSKKTYRKSYTDKPGYKKKEASKTPDISDIVKAYKDKYDIDLSHMKSKWSKKPRFNNGKVNKDLPIESYGGSWAKNNTIYLNPDLKPVLEYYGLDEDEDSLRKTIIAHELAHEVYNKSAVRDFIKQQLDEAKSKKFTTKYLEHVPDNKLDEETFCEYLADGINKKASKLYTYIDPEADTSLGLLSAKEAPEWAVQHRFAKRYPDKSKDWIIKHLESIDPERPKWIYAFDTPIPDKANEGLKAFRDSHKLVSWDPAELKDLKQILRRYHHKKYREEVGPDFEPLKRMRWGVGKDGLFMRHSPVYKVLTESGKVPPELLTIEDKDKYSIHGAILGCLGKNAKKFKYNITEDLPDDPWKAIINTDPVDIDTVKQFHKYHNVDVDNAGVPYYFLTKNNRTGEKAVWFSDSDKPIPINNKKEREKAKKIGLAKGLKEEQLDFKF